MSKAKYPNLAEAVRTGRGVEVPFVCDVHDDHSPSASVNLEKGVWTCYACGAGGRVGSGSVTAKMTRAISAMTEDTTPHVFDEALLDLYDAAGPSEYWAGRYGPSVARAFRCGTDPVTGAATYPMRAPNGALWGLVRRSTPKMLADGKPKYLYPSGVSCGRTLFNYRFGMFRTVVVVEGAGDVMAFHAAGVPNKMLVVGAYGAGLNAPQVGLVEKLSPQRVVLAFDNDEAGFVAGGRNYGFTTAQIVVVEWPDRVKDPGEAPPDLLKERMTQWMTW